MKTLGRLQISVVLALFSLIGVGGTVAGAIAFWDRHTLTYNLVTLFAAFLFLVCFGVSVSIALDRKLDDIPWGRLGFYLLFFLLGGGVAWARDMI